MTTLEINKNYGSNNKSKTYRDIIMDGIIITYVFIVLYTIHKKRFK